MEICDLTGKEIVQKIKKKELSASETVRHYLARIEKIEPSIAAFNEIFADDAAARAELLDARINRGEETGLLAGLPIAIKDNICINGRKTTCSSRILADYVSPYDATVIEKLLTAGAVIVGKTNMDEFAMGSSTENSAFHITKNPWDTSRVPGGSSGGSAAAVSSRMVPVSLGSDTGGSIRQPASFCGICGLKPTYGRVSRYGLMAFASSLDQIGPFAYNAEDVALVLESISGHDPKDSTSVNISAEGMGEGMEKSIKGLRVGLPKEYFISGLEPATEKYIRSAIETFKDLGAEIHEITLPNTEYAVSVYYIVAPSEASANLARYDGVKYGYRSDSDNLADMYEKTRSNGFGNEVKRRIMLGTYALSSGYYDAYYLKAQKVRALIKNDFDRAFAEVDVILTPTCPSSAFKAGEKTEDPLQMYLSDIFTISCNLAGICGISIPCGFSESNLPVGLQLLGKPFDEKTVLRAVYNFQSVTDFHRKKPL